MSAQQIEMAIRALVQHVCEVGPDQGGKDIAGALLALIGHWPTFHPGGCDDWITALGEARKVLWYTPQKEVGEGR